jgi:hypothetical protein
MQQMASVVALMLIIVDIYATKSIGTCAQVWYIIGIVLCMGLHCFISCQPATEAFLQQYNVFLIIVYILFVACALRLAKSYPIPMFLHAIRYLIPAYYLHQFTELWTVLTFAVFHTGACLVLATEACDFVCPLGLCFLMGASVKTARHMLASAQNAEADAKEARRALEDYLCKLQESRTQYQTLLKGAFDAVVLTEDGIVKCRNEGFMHIFPEVHVDTLLSAAFSEEDQPSVDALCGRLDSARAITRHHFHHALVTAKPVEGWQSDFELVRANTGEEPDALAGPVLLAVRAVGEKRRVFATVPYDVERMSVIPENPGDEQTATSHSHWLDEQRATSHSHWLSHKNSEGFHSKGNDFFALATLSAHCDGPDSFSDSGLKTHRDVGVQVDLSCTLPVTSQGFE